MKYIISIFLLFASFRAQPGEFTVTPHSNGASTIRFDGPITPGDTNKFLSLVKKQPFDVMNTPYLQLNSPGGSVIEAVRLGEQIEKSGFMATVQHGDTCASACFLLFISAQFRYMDNSAEILLHRPFISHPRTDLKGYDADRKLQQATTKALRDFLEERSVPSQLIDVMMNYPSNNAHRLTVPELQFGIHSISPTLEELTLARCGLTNENIGNSDRDFDSGSDTDDLHCIRHFTMQLKFDYVRSIIGEERFETEFNALKRRIKQRAK